jgi:16S rRNA (cytosine1402-N4)-methyltransferase
MTQDREYHRPVLAGEVVELLSPVPPGVVIDATFGGGGHARQLLKALGHGHRVIGIDRDPVAVARAKDEGGTLKDARLKVVRGNFANLAEILATENVEAPVGVLFDFGVSSQHFDDPSRGFSYRLSGPLDMRMDPDQELTASDLVNDLDEQQLAELIKRLGEEPAAQLIAAAIVRSRPISDTTRLAEVIASAVPRRARSQLAQSQGKSQLGRSQSGKFQGQRRLHPARRTFQALRMAVNGELEAIATGIDQALEAISVEGRCLAISYHSLEDRIVKRRFVTAVSGCVCPPDLPVCGCGASPRFRLLTRGAVKPSPAEVAENPRSRSARLRAVARVAA